LSGLLSFIFLSVKGPQEIFDRTVLADSPVGASLGMTGSGGDLNQSSQHFTFETEVECDETTTEAAFLYGGGER
jgi:hypothetical protein